MAKLFDCWLFFHNFAEYILCYNVELWVYEEMYGFRAIL